MKTCPKCNRTFPDEGQKFCTFDGGLLIAPQTFDPNATIRATSIDLNAPSERPTSRDLPDQNATIMENYPATVALPRNTGPTGQPTTVSDTADFSKPEPPPPPPAPPPPPPPAPPVASTATGASGPIAPVAPATPMVQQPAPSAPLPAPPAAKKGSKLPWILVGVLLFLLLGGGALAAVFFFVVKPKLDQAASARGLNDNRPVVTTNTNTNTATPEPTVEQPSPTPADTFVPPPNTVEFVASKDSVEGPLADHYFDFNFYYPKGWERVKSASNFAEVERRIPPNLTQENFVVGWYTSAGTFVGDLPSYPKRVEEFSNRLSKQFPEYRKVSDGPTKVNSMQGYEFRWEGLSKGTERGDVHLWGRVIFVPTGKEGDTTGATLSMFTTSLAPELSSVADVGDKGEAPVILDSFRFGKKN